MFEVRELVNAELFRGFNFTKGAPVLKLPALNDAKRPPMQGGGFAETQTRLYNIIDDPLQSHPFRSEEIEVNLTELIIEEMIKNDAPAELFDRFSLRPV
jgi:hypothetical protein